MANGFNQVTLFGNLGADPELRMTQSGQAVLNLRLATSETYLDKDKVRQERTEWHSVTVWGKRGEALARLLSKGARVMVVGRLRTSSYEDRDGIKRYRTGVVAEELLLAGSPGGQTRNYPPTNDFDGYEDPQAGGGGDDEIPF